MKINTLCKRAFLIATLAASANGAFATSTTYYSRCDASVATGNGSVYVSTTKETPTSYSPTSSQTQNSSLTIGSNPGHHYFLYAQPGTGYVFLNWSDGSTANPHEVNITAISKTESSPTIGTYKATFGIKPTVVVTVSSNNTSQGGASINPATNNVGDAVTIMADGCALDGYTFSYWTKEGSDEQITDNPYTFTVTTENSGNYIAHFTKSTSGGNGYYRVRNSVTGKYISLENNAFNYNSIVGSASSASANPDGCITNMLPFLQKDIKMVNNQTTNPGAILYVKKNSDGNYDLEAQGTSLYQLTNGYYYGTSAGHIQIKGAYATINRNSLGFYNVSVTMSVEGTTIGPVYFKDNNGKLTVEKDANLESEGRWYLEPVTSMNVEPLNANIKDSQGNLWTTLYCDFPFTLGDGVLGAYELKNITKKADGNSYAIPTQISGTVAGATPVLLKLNPANTEWNVNLTSDEPKMSQPSSETTGLLQGSCFDDAPATGDYNTAAASDETTANGVYNRKSFAIANDQTNNRVLYAGTVNGTDYPIGFYKLASTTKYMVANKAFLDLSKATTAAKGTVYLDLDGATTGINEINAEEQQPKEDVIYDLMGRRVTNPQHGIYIKNGKKVIYQ
jgi:hypothetical protein